MSFWGWASAIAAGWFTASALFAIAWNTVGKRIFRQPPQPPVKVDVPRAAEFNGVDLTPYVVDLEAASRKRNPKAGA